MKNLLLCSSLFLISAGLCGQSKPAPGKQPVKKSTTAKPAPVVELKTALDSFSYALGCSMAAFYKEQGIENINVAMVNKALGDIKKGKTLLNDMEINNAIMNYMQSAKSLKAEGEKKAGRAFLDSNKTRQGVVTLPSGLQYEVITMGTGEKPGPSDTVKVHYQGTLINGRIFDSSIQRGEPIQFSVGGVITGWTEALQLMPVGSKWKLFIPSDLAYGDSGAGSDIKPGSTLIFDVELLDIVKTK